MCQAIRHRGPDDEGLLVEPGVALGMRRLSIIDVATGHQPIHNEDGRDLDRLQRRDLQLSELRRELEAVGHRFSTGTDTEVIVHAYEQWGAGAFARLRGMFGARAAGIATHATAADRARSRRHQAALLRRP